MSNATIEYKLSANFQHFKANLTYPKNLRRVKEQTGRTTLRVQQT